MAIIADLSIPPIDFELGRVLSMEEPVSVVLQTLIPIDKRTIPFFWVHNDGSEAFARAVRDHETVEQLQAVEVHENRTLYAFRWHSDTDALFKAFKQTNAKLLEGSGHPDAWKFEVRFPHHEELAAFRELCEDSGIRLDVNQIYNPTSPEATPHYGLSAPQRETLSAAVKQGYYSIPRQISTNDLAAQYGISDQATTERLRRAIITLTKHTLLADESENNNTETTHSQSDRHRE